MPGASCCGHLRRTAARKSWGMKHMQQQPAWRPLSIIPRLHFLTVWLVSQSSSSLQEPH